MSKCLICGQKFKNDNWRFYKGGPGKHFDTLKCTSTIVAQMDERYELYEMIRDETYMMGTLWEHLLAFSVSSEVLKFYDKYRNACKDTKSGKEKE